MIRFRPDVRAHVGDVIRHLPPEIKTGVKAAIRALSEDPLLGEPLHRELEGYRKYRVRRFCITYSIDHHAKAIVIIAVGHRRTIYEEAAERVRRGS
jgi:mRNA interferase RelE/StbE